ncbi:hypothetical protein Ddye_024210 [Dipteronia dyeriana]|uniref:Uncharacterized protein n=1 Tax=Dipteronia dyeriana TaxID=168575 RepID=A0AAD9TUW5_9ROSI|nr:hypothetical protein Ddye_024210 [Dipteronia dyeriana]
MTSTTHHKMQNRSQKNLKRKPTMTTMFNNYQKHVLLPNQCGSNLEQTIDAPIPLVWSILRQFDHPQGYKQSIKSCTLKTGTGGTGSVREVIIITGLLARTSTERLDKLDDS